MDTIADFEDILSIFEKYCVKYLIIGGLAFIFHAKPRYTKDMDILIGPDPENIRKANKALSEFGSIHFIDASNTDEIVQLGLPPNRIDLLIKVPGVRFETAWLKRVKGQYGKAAANWIDIDSLIRSKKSLNHPRHNEDVRVLLEIKRLKKKKSTKS